MIAAFAWNDDTGTWYLGRAADGKLTRHRCPYNAELFPDRGGAIAWSDTWGGTLPTEQLDRLLLSGVDLVELDLDFAGVVPPRPETPTLRRAATTTRPMPAPIPAGLFA